MMTTTRWSASCLALTGLFLSVGPAAQQPDTQQPPTFRRAVNLVMVDAYPTAQGKPVLDLAQDEFQILEDGVPQSVAMFERKTFRAPVPEPLRAEPRTVAESNRMAADPRGRVFVLYLDTYHLPGLLNEGVNQYPARDAVRRWMRSLIGEDDVVGFLTPELDAETMTFTRRTSAIDEFLRERWMREIRVDDLDPTERMYQTCYTRDEEQWVLAEMIARKRERQVLKSLHELVNRLGDLREDRKAVLLVGGGWWVYGPDQRLAAPLANRPLPGSGRIGVDPTGRLGVGRRDDQLQGAFQECEKDRLMLANENHQREFQSLMGRANRANVSIYPIDPRGLAAPATVAGQDRLERLRSTMRDLASSTDGFTVIDTNDFERGMKRIVDDMSSYYLLGYYSTNAKLDGKFRKIAVRVKRPGVSVRARNGYLAPTEAEVAPPPPPPGPASAAAPRNPRSEAVAGALADLGRLQPGREAPANVAWKYVGAAQGTIGKPLLFLRGPSSGPGWVATTDLRLRRTDRLRVDIPTETALEAMAIALLDRTGKPLAFPVALAERTEGGVRYVTGEIPLAPLTMGDYLLEVRCREASGDSAAILAFRIVPQ
jgi:VWFA-related protein